MPGKRTPSAPYRRESVVTRTSSTPGIPWGSRSISVPCESSSLTLTSRELSFIGKINEPITLSVTLTNRNQCAVHFEWKKTEMKSKDDVFYMPVVSGIVLPCSAFDFFVIFRSPKAGYFFEYFDIKTRPYYGELKIRLIGTCFEEESPKKYIKEFHANLDHKVALKFASWMVNRIIQNAFDVLECRKPPVRPNIEDKVYVNFILT